MSILNKTLLVTLGVVALGGIAITVWYKSKVNAYELCLAKVEETALALHEKLMEDETYKNTDLGNRVMWVTQLLDTAVSIICKELEDYKINTIKLTVYAKLPTICNSK